MNRAKNRKQIAKKLPKKPTLDFSFREFHAHSICVTQIPSRFCEFFFFTSWISIWERLIARNKETNKEKIEKKKEKRKEKKQPKNPQETKTKTINIPQCAFCFVGH
jgi:hypothetical protein